MTFLRATHRPGRLKIEEKRSKKNFNLQSSILVLVLAFISVLPGRSHAQSASLYDRIHAITENEFLLGSNPQRPHTADPAVQSFISTTYRPDEGPLLPGDIPLALSGDISFCEPQPPPLTPDAQGRYLWPSESNIAGTDANTTRRRLVKTYYVIDRCEAVRNDVRKLAVREMRLRTLAQDLQLIAAAYEQPIMESPDLGIRTISRTRGLINIWRAGGNAGRGTPRGHTIPTTGRMAAKFTFLGTVLRALETSVTGREQLIAAVNRYQLGGYRYARGDRDGDWEDFPGAPVRGPFEAVGTERQYILWNWEGVEDALDQIWQSLRSTDFDPPLEEGDIVTFQAPAEYQDLLPDNVRFWGYVEKLEGGEVSGDAGLTWILPEPTLPSLCTDGTACAPIAGGQYPPEPVAGTALCTQPLARQGYLCRSFEAPGASSCSDITRAPGTIILAACAPGAEPHVTERGPDSCRGIQWHENAPAPVCTPGADRTEYRNSIGNNVCFFDTCLEEQTDDGFIPRDTGITVQAGTSPVISCIRPDLQLGSLDVAPVFRSWAPPPYRPTLLVRQLETALCAGMAPSGLSSACGFPLLQGLHQVQAGVLGPAEAVSNRGNERAQAIFDLQDRTDALGARVATRLYLDYMTQRADTLAGIIRRATRMFDQFPRATFPEQMCPFNDTDGANLLQTLECTP